MRKLKRIVALMMAIVLLISAVNLAFTKVYASSEENEVIATGTSAVEEETTEITTEATEDTTETEEVSVDEGTEEQKEAYTDEELYVLLSDAQWVSNITDEDILYYYNLTREEFDELLIMMAENTPALMSEGDNYYVEPADGYENLSFAGADATLFDINGGVYMGFCIDRDRGHYSTETIYTETAEVITDPNSKIYQTFYYGYGGPEEGGVYTFSSTTEAIVATSQVVSHYYSQTGTGLYYKNAIENLSADKIPPAHSMSLSATSVTATVSGSEQKTDWVTLNLDSRLSADVTIPSGVTLWIEGESSGHTGTATIQGGKRFYLTAPLSANGIKNVTMKYSGRKMLKINILQPPSSAYQPVAFYSYLNPSVTLDATFVGEGDIEIIKSSSNPSVSDVNSCYSLQGAVYGVYKYASDAMSDVNRVTSITTDANGYGKASGLEVRTYYVKEIVAPKGYALDSSVYTVTVNAGVTSTLRLTDVPQMDPVVILVTKQGDNGKKLEGAEFTVKFYAGIQSNTDPATLGVSVDRTWVIKTDDEGRSRLSDTYKVSGDDFYYAPTGSVQLPLGTVTIQETKAPEGYFIDDTVYVRQITSDGTSSSVNTYNAPVVTDEVFKQPFQLTKYMETEDGTNKPLSGAGFSACNVADLSKDAEGNYIWDSSKAVVITASGDKEMFTDENGYALSCPLEYGTYLVRETTVPEDCFAVDDFIVEVTIDSDEPQAMRYFTDEVFKGYVKIIKIDEETGESILNNSASFKIWSYENNEYVSFNGETVLSTNDKGELITPSPLLAGKYRIEEVSAPEGYVTSTITYDIDITSVDNYETYIDEDGNPTKMGIFTVEIDNVPVKASVKLIKHDMENYDKTLQGVKFELYMKNESGDICLGEYVTNENGEINISDLYYGEYYFIETETLYRYLLNTDKQYFEIAEDGITVELHVKNDGRIGTLNIWGYDSPDIHVSYGPNTGDSFNMPLVIFLAVFSMTGLFFVSRRMKKDESGR